MTAEEILAWRTQVLALPPGVEVIQFNQRSVTLSSQEDRTSLLAYLDRQLAALQGTAGATTYHLAATNKGY